MKWSSKKFGGLLILILGFVFFPKVSFACLVPPSGGCYDGESFQMSQLSDPTFVAYDPGVSSCGIYALDIRPTSQDGTGHYAFYSPGIQRYFGFCGISFKLSDLETTRIISLIPEQGTTTGNLVDFQLHAFIDPDDIGSYFNVGISLENLDNNTLIGVYKNFLDNFQATTSGDFYFSTSTILGDGNYSVTADLKRTYLGGWIVNPFALNQSLTHYFIVNNETYIGHIQQSSLRDLNSIFASTSATSTSALAGSCGPFSGVFNVFNCVAFLFVPDVRYLSDTLLSFRTGVQSHFPLGYLVDFVSIISTSTSKEIPFIEFSLPSALGFGSPHFKMGLASTSLDWVYNSTAGVFYSEGTDPNATFYSVTSYYWNYMVYILLVFYVISRLIKFRYLR